LEIFYSRLTAYVPRKEMKYKNRILEQLPIFPSSLLHLFIHSFIHPSIHSFAISLARYHHWIFRLFA